jgi:hypothetical protein
MNALRLENINLHSPYRVWQTQEDSHYYFQTDTGIQYDIVFAPDTSIINSGAYTIDIVNRQHVASPVDMKLRQTIIAIIEEFFEANGNEAMLYITETGDGKQMFRNRLFIRWFNLYSHHDKYIIKTAEGEMDGQDNFIAIFVCKTNPHAQYIIEVFELVTAILFDKLDQT